MELACYLFHCNDSCDATRAPFLSGHSASLCTRETGYPTVSVRSPSPCFPVELGESSQEWWLKIYWFPLRAAIRKLSVFCTQKRDRKPSRNRWKVIFHRLLRSESPFFRGWPRSSSIRMRIHCPKTRSRVGIWPGVILLVKCISMCVLLYFCSLSDFQRARRVSFLFISTCQAQLSSLCPWEGGTATRMHACTETIDDSGHHYSSPCCSKNWECSDPNLATISRQLMCRQ